MIPAVSTNDEAQIIEPDYRRRGFLPAADPLTAFPDDSPYRVLDTLGHELPEGLQHPGFRRDMRSLRIPPWSPTASPEADLPGLRLYYLRLGFLASGYVNQLDQPAVHALPASLAVPLCRACERLRRPPMLSYDGYALYNWRRLDPAGPIALDNLDTLQNFVPMYDEHWFILVHVEIEAIAARILDAVAAIQQALAVNDSPAIDDALRRVAAAVRAQTTVLRRIPEHMDHRLYHRSFRQYIRFFDGIAYQGVARSAVSYRGETGAQSSILPLLVALMKVDHAATALTDHLRDLRRYMPAEHRELLARVERLPDLRGNADPSCFDAVLEAMATFREVHLGWAQRYIQQHSDDPRGTGGTPYLRWLTQLIDETRAARLRAT